MQRGAQRTTHDTPPGGCWTRVWHADERYSQRAVPVACILGKLQSLVQLTPHRSVGACLRHTRSNQQRRRLAAMFARVAVIKGEAAHSRAGLQECAFARSRQHPSVLAQSVWRAACGTREGHRPLRTPENRLLPAKEPHSGAATNPPTASRTRLRGIARCSDATPRCQPRRAADARGLQVRVVRSGGLSFTRPSTKRGVHVPQSPHTRCEAQPPAPACPAWGADWTQGMHNTRCAGPSTNAAGCGGSGSAPRTCAAATGATARSPRPLRT